MSTQTPLPSPPTRTSLQLIPPPVSIIISTLVLPHGETAMAILLPRRRSPFSLPRVRVSSHSNGGSQMLSDSYSLPAARPLPHQFHCLPRSLVPYAEPPPSFSLHRRQVPNLSPHGSSSSASGSTAHQLAIEDFFTHHPSTTDRPRSAPKFMTPVVLP
jgi:hypothetical protein